MILCERENKLALRDDGIRITPLNWTALTTAPEPCTQASQTPPALTQFQTVNPHVTSL
jgi:hypothetical protein